MKGWRLVRTVAKESCGRRRNLRLLHRHGKLRIRSEINVSVTSKMEAARSSETSTRNKNPEAKLGIYYK